MVRSSLILSFDHWRWNRWIGGLGRSADHAIVMAQLFTPDGKNGALVKRGPHAFLVPIRDVKTRETLPVSLDFISSDWELVTDSHHRDELLWTLDQRLVTRWLIMELCWWVIWSRASNKTDFNSSARQGWDSSHQSYGSILSSRYWYWTIWEATKCQALLRNHVNFTSILSILLLIKYSKDLHSSQHCATS